jgi:hypothetical protein
MMKVPTTVFASALMFTAWLPSAYAQGVEEQPVPKVSVPPQSGAPTTQQPADQHAPAQAPVSGPAQMDWDGDGTPPNGYHLETRVRKGLVIAGAVTFGTMYLTTVIGAAFANALGSSRASVAFVPIAGPFIALRDVPDERGVALLVIDGVVQAAGATMLIVGLAAQKTVAVRTDSAKVEIMPVVGPGSVGLVGTF